MARLRIFLLGGFLLEYRGRSLPPIPSNAARSLFAYLVTNRDRRHTRDLLAGTLWPEAPETTARKRLSQALWQVQTVLGEVAPDQPLLHVTLGDVRFNTEADFWLDVSEFEERVTAAEEGTSTERKEIEQLAAAVDLYRGDFLAGFYDDWTLVEQERLRGLYLTALGRLVTLHKGRAAYDTALGYAQMLVLHDPLREEAHREVMRLCFLLGRSNEALRQYEHLEGILADELGTLPAPETNELRRQIAELREKGDRPFAPSPQAPLLDVERRIPLVGREEERVSVLRRLEEALVGHGGLVLVEGDAGIGKTRMLQELSDDAHWRGLSVLWAQCNESEILHPYQAMRRAFESGLSRLRAEQLREVLQDVWLGDVARIVPSLHSWLPDLPRPADLRPDEAGDRLRQALQRGLRALGDLSPHVLFIDDVQWIDEETIRVLGDLSPTIAEHGLLVCLSYRSDEARARPELWSELVRIDASARSERVSLRSLSQDESTRLVEESLGVPAVASDLADGLFLETGGNPLFLLETLRSWHDDAREQLVVGLDEEMTATIPDVEEAFPVSGGVAQVITRRFASLASSSRGVLNAAAVLGRIYDANLVAHVSGLSRREVLSAIDDLLRRGAVVEAHDGYDFAHYQIRRVALETIDQPERKHLHHAAAAALEDRHPERIEDLAYHYTSAAVPEKAMAFSWEAGTRSAALAAYDTAARHLENAVAWAPLVPAEPAQHFHLLADLEETLDVLGRRDDQAVAIDQMLQLAGEDASSAGEAQRRRSRLLAHRGSYGEALDAAEQGIALAAAVNDRELHGTLLLTLGLTLSWSGRAADAVPHLEAAVVTFAGDHIHEADARRALGDILGDLQRFKPALVELEEAFALYEDAGDQRGVAETLGLLAITHWEKGEGDVAAPLYERALELNRDLGYRRGEATNLLNSANLLYFESQPGEALIRYGEAAALLSELGDRRMESLARANAASVRHLVIGDDRLAAAEAQAALVFLAEENHPWGEAHCRGILASIALRAGDTVAARRELDTGLALLAGGGHRWLEAHLLRSVAQLELDEGHIAEATLAIEEARAICAELGLEDVAPSVESVAGMVALAAGDADAALRLTRSATARMDRSAERSYVVWFHHHLAAAAAGAEDEARDALAEAYRLLNRSIEGLAPGDREKALTLVPENRDIIQARQRTWSQHATATLPRFDVPLGRRLRPDDWIEVRWTVTDPDDHSIDDPAERRRHRLLRLLGEAEEQGGAPRVEDLAGVLEVSEITVRRDLGELRSRGHRVPTRGRRA